jgi:DHA1 family multidrug resistance protein-like MFS transporter
MQQASMHNRRNLAILFFTLVVMMMGFGMVIPILPFYIESFGASGLGLGFLIAIFSIMQFIFSPIWGGYSDRYGRKPMLIIGALGNAISLVLFGLSTELWMIYAARALGGILSAATLPTAMAYISDTTEKKNRGGGMGVIGAAMGMGLILGPGLGGLLAGESLSTPFFVASGLSMLALFLILIFLPESLAKTERVEGVKIKGFDLKLIWQSLFGPLGYLMILSFVVFFGLTNFEGIFGLYAQHRFDYNPVQVGWVMMVIGLISTIVQGVLTGPLTRRYGERQVIKFSLIGSSIGFLVMLAANSDLTLYITVGLFVFANAMLRPGIASLVSTETQTGQGASLGLANSFMSLGRIVGPLWAGMMFDIHISLPYLSGAVIFMFLFLISFNWLRKPARSHSGQHVPLPPV